jgi:hypothetical protein
VSLTPLAFCVGSGILIRINNISESVLRGKAEMQQAGATYVLVTLLPTNSLLVNGVDGFK